MDTAKQYWEQVNSFYKTITPKCDKCKEIEEKIKVPLHYIFMAITVLVVAIFYLLTRKSGFFSYFAFFISAYFFMESVHHKKGEEKKWVVYWFMFAFVEMATKTFNKNIYVSFLKCSALLYFVFAKDNAILETAMEKCCDSIQKGCDWYMNTLCKDKTNWSVC